MMSYMYMLCWIDLYRNHIRIAPLYEDISVGTYLGVGNLTIWSSVVLTERCRCDCWISLDRRVSCCIWVIWYKMSVHSISWSTHEARCKAICWSSMSFTGRVKWQNPIINHSGYVWSAYKLTLKYLSTALLSSNVLVGGMDGHRSSFRDMYHEWWSPHV